MLVDANKIQVMPAPNPDTSKVSTDLDRPKQSTNYMYIKIRVMSKFQLIFYHPISQLHWIPSACNYLNSILDHEVNPRSQVALLAGEFSRWF
jgi:hypothetical protein